MQSMRVNERRPGRLPGAPSGAGEELPGGAGAGSEGRTETDCGVGVELRFSVNVRSIEKQAA